MQNVETIATSLNLINNLLKYLILFTEKTRKFAFEVEFLERDETFNFLYNSPGTAEIRDEQSFLLPVGGESLRIIFGWAIFIRLQLLHCESKVVILVIHEIGNTWYLSAKLKRFYFVSHFTVLREMNSTFYRQKFKKRKQKLMKILKIYILKEKFHFSLTLYDSSTVENLLKIKIIGLN